MGKEYSRLPSKIGHNKHKKQCKNKGILRCGDKIKLDEQSRLKKH